MPSRSWTRDELLIAINLYCRVPFGRLHHTHPEIVTLAKSMGRTPSSVSMKLCNFASLDPALRARNIKGLGNASRLDVEVWREVNSNWEKAVYESQKRLLELELLPPEESDDGTDDLLLLKQAARETDAMRAKRVRLVQGFFRRAVLASYGSRCSFCGLSIKQLLVASHIIPWKDSVELRADPRNGICLCALHDKAFDRGLLGISEDYRIIAARSINRSNAPILHRVGLIEIVGSPVAQPHRFLPDPQSLQMHRERWNLR